MFVEDVELESSKNSHEAVRLIDESMTDANCDDSLQRSGSPHKASASP